MDLDSLNLDFSVVLAVTNLAVTVTLGLEADDLGAGRRGVPCPGRQLRAQHHRADGDPHRRGHGIPWRPVFPVRMKLWRSFRTLPIFLRLLPEPSSFFHQKDIL